MSLAEIINSVIAVAALASAIFSAVAAHRSYKVAAKALEWQKDTERRQQEAWAHPSRAWGKQQAQGGRPGS